jgi:hypothetical protein
MRVRLRFERVYGTISGYGENPRESPPDSPILLEDYPLPGERVTIYLGQPVEELLWFNENGHLDKGDKVGKGGVPPWQRNDATMAMNSSERRSGW